jgi:hypothetical protein
MKFLNLIYCLALPALFFSTACKKRGQFEVPCKIEKITSLYRFHPEDPIQVNVSTFTHNNWGDPVSIIHTTPTTGRPNYYFYYDNKHRLTAFKGDFGNGNIDFYTRYFYDNNNFIVRDTTFYAGSDINNPASFLEKYANTYTYDPKGRVSKVVSKRVGSSFEFERTYAYNAQDNLITPGVTYDNKTNFFRTSLVLAFVNRNYSRNNYANAQAYNSKGLPTSFPIDGGNHPLPQLFNTQVNEIEYTCDNHRDND